MDTLDIKTIAPAQSRKNRVVPQGYNDRDELIAIRELLVLERVVEARQRLERLLTGLDSAWRCGRERH
jgi:hypothetical protein